MAYLHGGEETLPFVTLPYVAIIVYQFVAIRLMPRDIYCIVACALCCALLLYGAAPHQYQRKASA